MGGVPPRRLRVESHVLPEEEEEFLQNFDLLKT